MIHRLAELSFTQVDALDRDRTGVLFAVSPLEEHGPHLPIGTDLFHAEYFNEELARRIIEARPYRSVGELDRVKGIGKATMAKLRDRITVD